MTALHGQFIAKKVEIIQKEHAPVTLLCNVWSFDLWNDVATVPSIEMISTLEAIKSHLQQSYVIHTFQLTWAFRLTGELIV